jgi:hypothetical protein
MKLLSFACLLLLVACSSDDASQPIVDNGDSAPTNDSSTSKDASVQPPTDSSVTVDATDAADAAPPMCLISADCTTADVTYPQGNTSTNPTTCVRNTCGLVTYDTRGGALGTKTPVTCDTVCASSQYKGKPMACSSTCGTAVINGFGDKGLVWDNGSDGGSSAGSQGGMATYQFNNIGGAYQFTDLQCGTLPTKTVVQNGSQYKYSSQTCCCVGVP